MRSAIVLLVVALVVVATCQDEPAAAAAEGKWTREQVLDHVKTVLASRCFNFRCRMQCWREEKAPGYCGPENSCVCVPKSTAAPTA